MAKKLLFVFFFVLVLGACSGDELTATQTPTEIALIPTRDVSVTVPVNTQTVVPTSTRTPSPTDTPTLNATATITPAPTATSTITPTPTPTVAVWVESGTPISQSEVIGLENVGQITELARWGRGVIRDIDLSADGRWLAVAAGSGAYIHDLQDLQAKPVAFEMAEDVTAVSISPTGDKIAIVMGDKLQLWQVKPRKLVKLFVDEFINRVHEIIRAQFSPDGRVLAIVERTDSTNTVEIWDSEDGSTLTSYWIRNGSDSKVKFSPSGSKIAFWSPYRDKVAIYDWEQDLLALEYQAPIHHWLEGVADEDQPYQALVGDVAFKSEDDLRLLVVEGELSIRTTGRFEIQDTNKDSIIFSTEYITYPLSSLEKACNDSDYRSDAPDPLRPTQMEVSSNLRIVALKYQGGSLRFHQIPDGVQPYFIEKGVVDFEFSPDGQTWVVGLNDGRLQVRRLSDGAVLESVDAYESPILDTIVSQDDAWVGVIYRDEVKVYQRTDGELQYRYPAATKIAFAPDNKSFTLAYQDGRLELYDISNGELIKTIVGHDGWVTALDYLPTGELLSAGSDCNIMMWEMPELTPMDSLETILVDSTMPEDTEEEKVAVHIQDFLVIPDGQTVVGQFFDFGVWGMEDGRLIREPSSDYQEYSELLAVSLDGKSLAVPQHRIPESWDDSLTFIETDADVAGFSPDARLLVGDPWRYAEDYEYGGMLNVWQVEPKQLLNTVGEKTESITAVTFTQDGQLIISSGQDGIVRLWGIP